MSPLLDSPSSEGQFCSIHLRIKITPLPACPLHDVDPEVIVHDARSMKLGEECHCEFVLEYPEEDGRKPRRVRRNEQKNGDCPCCSICEAGCLPNIVDIRDGALIVETFVRDRDQAFDVLAALNETPAKSELLCITENDATETPCTARIDLSQLTETQRETIEVAFERGYYDSPKGVILEDLAAEFGISKQAIAQRLASAEHKIIRQVAGP